MIAALVAVFVLSGAAGLIYESIWTRYLGLFVGHSAYAQIIVLVIFLGGMSLGAHLAGRWSDRLRAPLLWYAGVELFVGLFALAFHDAFLAVTAAAYDRLFPSLTGPLLLSTKWLIAGALILPQSVLLGATFPLMSAGVIRLARASEAPGRLLGLLYFANSIGAAVGVLLAGFWLIRLSGLPGTLLVAGFLNVVAAGVVALIARSRSRNAGVPDPTSAPAASSGTAEQPEMWRPLLIVAFGTAVASFIYEIAWIRMLSLVHGSATHSFELMLSAFILGLALGALWIRRRADSLSDPVRFLGIVQWTMGLLAVATLPFYIASFDWIASVLQTVQQNQSGYRAFVFARYVIALVVMLPATFCAGMTLPLITRVLMRAGRGERAIGAVYAVNTLGSIAGVILAGLILMPVLGLKKLLIAGALIDMGLGVWLVVLRSRREQGAQAQAFSWNGPLRPPLLASVVVLVLVSLISPFDLVRLTSGVFRHGVVPTRGEYTVPFYADGRTASVSVRRGGDGFITLATNGKPDASMEREWMTPTSSTPRELNRDLATQLLLPIVTLAHAPAARTGAIIGQGSGMSSHVLLGSPLIREVVTIEIEPEMIRGSRAFYPANRRVFDDKRSTFVIDDAKSYFAASRRQFDLILSEPSNPWVSGVSGLFTEEFYSRVRHQLAPRGIFGQWLHLYELNDALVTSVLAAIDRMFPSYEIFYTSNSDILVVAANQKLREPDWKILEYPGIAADMRRVVPYRDESFEALRLAGRDVLHPMLVARGAGNSDFFPVLDLGAEQTRFMHDNAEGYTGLTSSVFDVVSALSGRRVAFGTLGTPVTPEIARAAALALGVRIRAYRTMSPTAAAPIPLDDDLRAALYRQDELERVMATGRAPSDWHPWVDAVLDVDTDLHSGTAGVVDSAFFGRLQAFTSKAGAPLEARACVAFLRGIGSWDWPQAASAYQTIIGSKDPVVWLPDTLLRNGAAVAYVMMRDTAGAAGVLRTFAKRTQDDMFRERLIRTFLIYQDSTLRKRMGWK